MKTIHQWGYPFDALDDAGWMSNIIDAAKVCGVLGVNGRWATDERVEKTLELWDGPVSLTFLPYSDFKIDTDGDLRLHDEVVRMVRHFATCLPFKGRVQRIFFDDVEKLHADKYPDDPTPLYDLAYGLCAEFFPDASITWYADLSAPELRLEKARKDGHSFHLYRPQHGRITLKAGTMAVDKATNLGDGKPVTAFCHIGGYYYKQTPWPDLDPIHAYHLGSLCGHSRETDDVCLWPGLYDKRIGNFADVFAAFVAGLDGQEMPREATA